MNSRMFHPPDLSDDSDGFSDDPDYLDYKVRIQDIKPRNLSPEEVLEQERTNKLKCLFNSLSKGDFESVFKEIDEGINVDEELSDHWTPILLAASYGQPIIVKGLINKGANVNASREGCTALMMACGCPNYISDFNSSLEIIKVLVENGASVKAVNKKRMTPLMFAASNGHLLGVKYLLPLSDKEREDNQGWTALYWAINSNHVEVVKYLLDSNCNYEIKDLRNSSPLDLARSLNFYDIINLFPEDEDDILAKILYSCPSNSEDICNNNRPKFLKDIYNILNALNSDTAIKNLSDQHITLNDFLSLNNKDLMKWNIQMPFQRNRILNGLYKFHKHPYHPKSLLIVSPKEVYTNVAIATQLLTIIKQTTAMDASLKFIQKNYNDFKDDNKNAIYKSIKGIQTDLNSLQQDSKKLESKIIEWDAFVTPADLVLNNLSTWNPPWKIIFALGLGALVVYLKFKKC